MSGATKSRPKSLQKKLSVGLKISKGLVKANLRKAYGRSKTK